jgi:hypothetical protein
MQAFVANSDRSNILVSIGRLSQMRLQLKLRKLYERVDMYEEADNPNMVDTSGYLGLFYREKKTLTPINEPELLDILVRDNKLQSVMKVIKEIDSDNNGYVTN